MPQIIKSGKTIKIVGGLNLAPAPAPVAVQPAAA